MNSYIEDLVGDENEQDIYVEALLCDKWPPVFAAPNNLTIEQAFDLFMERYSEAMKELAEREKEE